MHNHLFNLLTIPVRQLPCYLATQLPVLPFSFLLFEAIFENIARLCALAMRVVIQPGLYSGYQNYLTLKSNVLIY